MDFSTLQYLRGVYEENIPKLEFRAQAEPEFAEWKEQVRAQLLQLLGPFPDRRCALDPVVTDTWEHDGFVRQRVIFHAEERVPVPCYVLIPDRGSPPYPALLCIHGHGRGKDDVVGIADSDDDRAHVRRLNYDYARQFAWRGYLCICPDIRCFGERADPDGSGCLHAFLNALFIGRQLKGLQLWDVLRAVDYAVSRPDVDAQRLGCLGLSMGGELTMYAAILDERCYNMLGLRERLAVDIFDGGHEFSGRESLTWFDRWLGEGDPGT